MFKYFFARGFLVRATNKMIIDTKNKYEGDRLGNKSDRLVNESDRIIERDGANYTNSDGSSSGGEGELKIGESTLIDSSGMNESDMVSGEGMGIEDPAIKSILRTLKN